MKILFVVEYIERAFFMFKQTTLLENFAKGEENNSNLGKLQNESLSGDVMDVNQHHTSEKQEQKLV